MKTTILVLLALLALPMTPLSSANTKKAEDCIWITSLEPTSLEIIWDRTSQSCQSCTGSCTVKTCAIVSYNVIYVDRSCILP